MRMEKKTIKFHGFIAIQSTLGLLSPYTRTPSNNSILLCHISCVCFSSSYHFLLLDSIQFYFLHFDWLYFWFKFSDFSHVCAFFPFFCSISKDMKSTQSFPPVDVRFFFIIFYFRSMILDWKASKKHVVWLVSFGCMGQGSNKWNGTIIELLTGATCAVLLWRHNIGNGFLVCASTVHSQTRYAIYWLCYFSRWHKTNVEKHFFLKEQKIEEKKVKSGNPSTLHHFNVRRYFRLSRNRVSIRTTNERIIQTKRDRKSMVFFAATRKIGN